jgi:hypothetical protein
VSEQMSQLDETLKRFIADQHMFFVGTAGKDGRVNISPKGMDSLRVIDSEKIVWLNLTGSGNETAAHVLENDRMTVMFCSFDKHPIILRLYGQARVIHPRGERWDDLIGRFPDIPGARQVFELDISLVQKSCGYAVPYYQFGGERTTLKKWSENKDEQELKAYWEERNTHSLDGKPTGITQTR